MTANGQTEMVLRPNTASGGTNNILGLFNAYNRVKASAICGDSTSSWTYATATWRAANGSNGNRISWIDGLQQVYIRGSYGSLIDFAAAGNDFTNGFNLDSASGQPNYSANAYSAAGVTQFLTVAESFYSQMGLHYLQAMECSNSGTQTIYGAGAMSLQWEGEV